MFGMRDWGLEMEGSIIENQGSVLIGETSWGSGIISYFLDHRFVKEGDLSVQASGLSVILQQN